MVHPTFFFFGCCHLFQDIADSSKILFNIGLIYATLGEHEVAVENFRAATNLDQYLAVAYFQCGVSNFLLGLYDEAIKNFEDALLVSTFTCLFFFFSSFRSAPSSDRLAPSSAMNLIAKAHL